MGVKVSRENVLCLVPHGRVALVSADALQETHTQLATMWTGEAERVVDLPYEECNQSIIYLSHESGALLIVHAIVLGILNESRVRSLLNEGELLLFNEAMLQYEGRVHARQARSAREDYEVAKAISGEYTRYQCRHTPTEPNLSIHRHPKPRPTQAGCGNNGHRIRGDSFADSRCVR